MSTISEVSLPIAPVSQCYQRHNKAVAMLMSATLLWAISFPLIKTMQALQIQVAPSVNSLFLASFAMVVRFGLSAMVLSIFSFRALLNSSKSEIIQGVGAGLFASVAILFQSDALNYTTASTTAFLTNCYCIIIPLFVAIQRRQRPTLVVTICCLFVLIGTAVLSNIDFSHLTFGRGEMECLLSSAFFGALIIWLGRDSFYKNRTSNSSIIMYSLMTITGMLVMGLAHSGSDLLSTLKLVNMTSSANPYFFVMLMLVISIFCTLFPYTIMNLWQREVDSTEAGLIYCSIPVFASLFALFIPSLLSNLTGLHYFNEHLTSRVLIGGTFITLANVGIQLRSFLKS